jgi:glycosyl transferase, family 25
MENIDAVVYINLDRRTDRREQFEGEMAKMGITNYIRFAAIEARPGMLGCHASHLAVIKMARANGWKNVMVFEDDFMFTMDKDTFSGKLSSFMTSDISWNALMLSYNLRDGKDYNEDLGIVKRAQSAAGYIVNSNIYNDLIRILEENYQLLVETHKHWIHTNDVCWWALQERGGWFYMKPRCGVQRPGYSDLGEAYVDYGV